MNVYLTALVDSDPEMAQLALTPPRTNGPQNDLSKLPRGPKLQDQVHLLGYPLTITPEIIPREDPRSKTNTIFPEIPPPRESIIKDHGWTESPQQGSRIQDRALVSLDCHLQVLRGRA